MKVKITDIKWIDNFTEEDELQSGVCVPDLPTELETEVPDGTADVDGYIFKWLKNTYQTDVDDFTYEKSDDIPVVSVQRQARFILTDLNHLINYARGCARTKRAGEDIDDEGMDIIRSLKGLFRRLGITPEGLSESFPA